MYILEEFRISEIKYRCLKDSLNIQCNPDIRELSGPETKYLISGFGLFCLRNTGSNLEPEKKILSYIRVSYIRVHCM